jgi:hypothetical protein
VSADELMGVISLAMKELFGADYWAQWLHCLPLKSWIQWSSYIKILELYQVHPSELIHLICFE